MRQHLNTLYVTTENAWLHKDGENVVVKGEGSERGRVPIHLLGAIVCFGSTGATPALLGHCAQQGVCVSFLNRNGRFLARVEGPTSGNVLLRRNQYRVTDDAPSNARLAKSIVIAKLLNQRTVVRRALRDHRSDGNAQGRTKLATCEQRLGDAARRANATGEIDSLRGIEGEGARIYYGVFNELIRRDEKTFEFSRRSRRPPLDPVNAVLSFLYTLLVQDCRSALETTGLDPAVGFLHRERPGRPSLALDMMEELRPVLADRLTLSLINRQQLTGKDFETGITGGVLLRDQARKTVLIAYQERKKDELSHPFLKEKTSLGLVPFLQAKLLAQHIRGELDGYPPFVWK